VKVSPAPRQPPATRDQGAAPFAPVSNFLPSLVPFDGIFVPHCGLAAELAHGLAPPSAMSGCLLAMPRHRQQMGIFVPKRRLHALRTCENRLAQDDGGGAVFGDPGAHAKVLPDEPGRLWHRVLRAKLGKKAMRFRLDFGEDGHGTYFDGEESGFGA
jgi:hypothetical protein